MSDIVEAIKDAVNPKRREQATVESYDAQKRGPYADRRAASDGQPQVAPPSEAQNPGRAEQSDLSNAHTAAAGRRSGSVTSQTLGAVNLDGDRDDGSPGQGRSDFGAAAAKPVHKEGGKYGLS